MKKIFLLASIMPLSLSVFSQASVNRIMKTSLSVDSAVIANTGSGSVLLQISAVYGYVSVQATVTKNSGTVAGTVLLSGSVDGTNYINLNTDTLTCTDQTTNTKVWVLTGNKYLYYKLTELGVGTMNATLKGRLYASNQGASTRAAQFMKSVWTLNSDTVVNTATEYMTLQLSGFYTSVTAQVVITKISGTAGGTVTLQGSNDATNYVTVSTDYSTAQTLSVSNTTTNTKFFVITGSPYAYYRFKYAGTGTMSCTIKGYLLPNQ